MSLHTWIRGDGDRDNHGRLALSHSRHLHVRREGGKVDGLTLARRCTGARRYVVFSWARELNGGKR